MADRQITSVQDLIAALEEDQREYQGSVWYRGHADQAWGLLPSYMRLREPPSESTLLKRFKQNAAMLLEREPKDSFDWMFLMQHYGLPTRLLDWTESPLVALYFAVEGYARHPESDAAIFCLRPCELNRKANILDHNEEFFIPSFDDDELKNYSIESLAQGSRRTRLLPVATIATRNNPRIQAQLGVFTIHHLDETPISAHEGEMHVVKYIIPQGDRERLLNQLHLLGYSKFTMFPELASIGENIKRDLT